MKPIIYVINGPNINLLGMREPHIYGTKTIKDLQEFCDDCAQKHGFELDFRQSNHEGEIIDWLQEARTKANALIINGAAFTHTSVAIHDALKALEIYKVEVHISNPHSREEFRKTSFVSPAVNGVIAGFGFDSYRMAFEACAKSLDTAK